MKTFVLVLVVLALVGCSGCVPEKDTNLRVTIDSVTFSKPADNTGKYLTYTVKVRIHGRTGYNGAGQEVLMTCANFPESRAVEYFAIAEKGWEYHEDIHHDLIGSSHHMTLYPAEVEGVDMASNGFAMLPANKDGTFTEHIDTTGWIITNNKEYRDNHEVRGHFTKTGKPLTWSIVSDHDGLTVTIDGESTRYDAKPENTVIQ